jgi:3'-phosphoadenosine 5'-phosphosulfate sulfotransferase (PAPS reductase)/FAD synthetase
MSPYPIGPQSPLEASVDAACKMASEVLYAAEEGWPHPIKMFLLCSGGYDSLVASYISDDMIRCGQARGYWGTLQPHLVYINTKIGIEANRQFVHRYAALYFREECFSEYVTPESYEQWCFRHGFPGPPSHRWIYIRLKERCIKQLVRDSTYQVDEKALHDILNELHRFHPLVQHFLVEQIRIEMRKAFDSRKQRVMFITGVRKQESERRSLHVEPIQIRGREVWVSPLTEWSKQEVMDVWQWYRMPRNEVADTLHRSKDCLCGAFAAKGEMEEIKLWYPREGAYLEDLQRRVMAAGFPWGWEEAPPAWWNEQKKGQLALPWPEQEELELQARSPKPDYRGFFPLCSTCHALQQETGGGGDNAQRLNSPAQRHLF